MLWPIFYPTSSSWCLWYFGENQSSRQSPHGRILQHSPWQPQDFPLLGCAKHHWRISPAVELVLLLVWDTTQGKQTLTPNIKVSRTVCLPVVSTTLCHTSQLFFFYPHKAVQILSWLLTRLPPPPSRFTPSWSALFGPNFWVFYLKNLASWSQKWPSLSRLLIWHLLPSGVLPFLTRMIWYSDILMWGLSRYQISRMMLWLINPDASHQSLCSVHPSSYLFCRVRLCVFNNDLI